MQRTLGVPPFFPVGAICLLQYDHQSPPYYYFLAFRRLLSRKYTHMITFSPDVVPEKHTSPRHQPLTLSPSFANLANRAFLAQDLCGFTTPPIMLTGGLILMIDVTPTFPPSQSTPIRHQHDRVDLPASDSCTTVRLDIRIICPLKDLRIVFELSRFDQDTRAWLAVGVNEIILPHLVDSILSLLVETHRTNQNSDSP